MLSRKESKIITVSIISFAVVALIGLIYAAFTGQLNITGTSVQRRSSWDIHFENLSSITTTGSAKVLSEPSLNGDTSIEDYNVSTTSPGDQISFTFKVINDGNYDAEISSINIGTPTCTGTDETSNNNVCNNLTYTLTDENGASIQVGDKLLAKDSKVMKVTLLYQEFSDASLLPTADVSIGGLGITINYEQSGSALVKDNGEVVDYKVYHVGDKATVNNEDYWVIENSGVGQDYVVALKDLPLTAAEIVAAGGDVGFTHSDGVTGGVLYGSNEIYETSSIKNIVDNWTESKFVEGQLKNVNNYNARLIQRSELISGLGYLNRTSDQDVNSNVPIWVYSDKYFYWTMTPYQNNRVVIVQKNGNIRNFGVGSYYDGPAVRPVINVYKSALEE